MAVVLAHVVAERPLGWLRSLNDTPIAASGETGDAGDDFAFETATGERVEAQAKSGLIGPVRVAQTIKAMDERRTGRSEAQLLVVDPTSSQWIPRRFKTDLDRLRSGRSDAMGPETEEVLAQLGSDVDLSQLPHVVLLDVQGDDALHTHAAEDLLATRVLRDEELGAAAFATLVAESSNACARRLRVDRAAAIASLQRAGFELRPVGAEERTLDRLELAKTLLDRWNADAALSLLGDIDRELATGASVRVRHLAARYRAAAFLQLGRLDEADASSRSALELDPQSPDGQRVAAIVALRRGDLSDADALSSRAIELGPHDAKAWAARLSVIAANAGAEPDAPQDVRTSYEYKRVLCDLLAVRGDYDRALDVSAELLADPRREPEALVVRGMVLLEAGRRTGSIPQAALRDVERLASEAIGELDDKHPLAAKAHVVRAAARDLLGRTDEAESDLQAASQLYPTDPDVVRNLASTRLESNDEDGALEALALPATNGDALLLALRAEILARRGRQDESARDITAAFALVADHPDPIGSRLALADACIQLGDIGRAEQALSGLQGEALASSHAKVSQARLAAARVEMEPAKALYFEAAEADPGRRTAILAELLSALLRAGDDEGARAVLAELTTEDLPPSARQMVAGAAARAGDYSRADIEVQRALRQEPPPRWAIELAVDLAILRDDPERAIDLLTELLGAGDERARLRIALAALLLDVGRMPEAIPHLDGLSGAARQLPPRERMQVAELLARAGRGPEALPIAMSAYRERRSDPDMHRALIGFALLRRITIPELAAVVPDAHVAMSDERGDRREHTILADGPFDRAQGELPVDEAQAMGLLGKSVGDTVIEHDGTWQQREWTIDEVTPAVVHLARDAAQNYERRFPQEQFFLTSVPVGDMDGPAAFAQMIGALHERQRWVGEVLTLQKARTLPLGVIARMLGVSTAELMDAYVTEPASTGPLWVEFADHEGVTRSAASARTAERAVLTRSALVTLGALDLKDALVDALGLVAPRSLVTELETELAEAHEDLSHGKAVLLGGETGLGFTELQAGDSHLGERVDLLEGLLVWVREHVRVLARPLDWIAEDDGSPESLRGIVGSSAFDALALAAAEGLPMYADDLGLRRLDLRGAGPPTSFSTPALLTMLTDRGAISTDVRDKGLVELAGRGYASLLPAASLLIEASALPAADRTSAERVFALLGNRVLDLRAAASIAAVACREVATQTLQVMPLQTFVEMCLRGLATGFTRRQAAAALESEASDRFVLLPTHREQLEETCRRFRDAQA